MFDNLHEILQTLEYEPVFDVEVDIDQIRMRKAGRKSGKGNFVAVNKTELPYLRAYILTRQYEPIAIFDRLLYDGFEAFIRVATCIGRDAIKNSTGYIQEELADLYRELMRRKKVKCSYRLALFNADVLVYHLLVPIDLVIYLHSRFSDNDIMDRRFWWQVTQHV